jgi:hypothetical protein
VAAARARLAGAGLAAAALPDVLLVLSCFFCNRPLLMSVVRTVLDIFRSAADSTEVYPAAAGSMMN